MIQDGCTVEPLVMGPGEVPQTTAWCCRDYVVEDVQCLVPEDTWHTFLVCTSRIVLSETKTWWTSTCDESPCKYLVMNALQDGRLAASASAGWQGGT